MALFTPLCFRLDRSHRREVVPLRVELEVGVPDPRSVREPLALTIVSNDWVHSADPPWESTVRGVGRISPR